MGSRNIVTVKLKAWLSFWYEAGGIYFFKLRVCKYLVVADYPLIQLGVSWIDLIEATTFSLAEVLQAAPLFILQNASVPYYNLSGTWTCPEDIKFDKATAPSIVDPGNYTALSVIPWTVPRFFESTLMYIPIADNFTDIPDSKTDYTKTALPGNGAIFMPNKNQYSLYDYTFATRHAIFQTTDFTYWGQMFYDQCDIGSDHILNNYTINHPTATDPNSADSNVWGINSCHSTYGGYTIYYDSGSGLYEAKVDRYETASDPEYYPPREPITGGDGGGFFRPLFMKGFLAQGGIFGIRVHD